jgi:type IV pilus assembly protein PilC
VVIVSAILLLFVVPQCQKLFEGFGADVPAFTLFVIDISKVLQASWWAVLAVINSAVVVFVQTRRRSPRLNRSLDIVLLKIPVIGSILTILYREIRAYAGDDVFRRHAAGGGDGLGGQATGNALYRKATLRMKDEVATAT